MELNLGVWLEQTERGPIMAFGKYQGEFLDDVPESYISWILESADRRPTPEEELAMREAIGEIVGPSGRQQGDQDWHNVIIGTWSFKVPDAVAQAFDREMRRMLKCTKSPVTAFEAIIANSALTSLEELS